jgi:hypothetical protein
MAKIILNPLVEDIRNRMGGFIYSKNRSGNYVKAYAKPKNPDTEAQRLTREIFSRLAKIWQAVKGQARASWNQKSNSKSGYNLFMAENFQKLKNKTALTLFRDFGLAPLRDFTVIQGSEQGKVTCRFSPVPLAGLHLSIFAHKIDADNRESELIRLDFAPGAGTGLEISGLLPGRYIFHALVLDSLYGEAEVFSESSASDVVEVF